MPCYIRLPVELPEACIARLTTTTTVIGGHTDAMLLPEIGPLGGPDRVWPERVWTVQDPVIPPPPGVTVVLQFTDAVSRDATMALTTTLTGLGWVISDGTAGGEQVSSGPDQNEVRFFGAADSAAAIQLAEALYALDPSAPVAVRDFTRLGSYAQAGLLEVWLNSLTLVPAAPAING